MDLSESWAFGQVASLIGIDENGPALSTAGHVKVIRPVLCFMPGKPRFVYIYLWLARRHGCMRSNS